MSWPLADHSDLRNDLAILMYAMNRLGGHFPLIGMCMYLLTLRNTPCLPRMFSTCSCQDPEAFSLKSVFRIILDQWTYAIHVMDIFFRVSSITSSFLSLVLLWTTYYIPLTSFHDSLHISDHFLRTLHKPYVYNFRLARSLDSALLNL